MAWSRLKEDIRAVFDNDPAAKNMVEVLLTYPGLHALWFHRVSHWFYCKKMFTAARLVSHMGRFATGIEIHPGAQIGRRVFIDHGMGIVVGETTEIGDDCLLYKGVVLGGTSTEKKKRHPTLGRCVVVGSNACVLGAINIGDGARIGSGSVVIRDVPPGATVVGVPGRVVHRKGTCAVEPGEEFENKLRHADLPDPLVEVITSWLKTLEGYEQRIKALEQHHEITSENLAEKFRKEVTFLPEHDQPDMPDDEDEEKE